MRSKAARAGYALIPILGLALVVGAQGPPPPGGFGHRGPGPGGPMAGSFEFGGLVGGFSGKTVTGKPFQAKFTITRVETLPNNSITNTVTGVLARDGDGSTYRDVTLPAIGPWASAGKPQEFIFIKNVAKQMNYMIDVSKGTYREFSSQARNASGGDHKPGWGPHGGAKGGGPGNETVTDNPSATYSDPATGTSYKVDDKKVTRTIPAGEIGNQNEIVITSERWYSADLDLVLQETRSDPRFGNSTYQVTNLGATTVSFTPDPSLKLVQGGKFGPGRGPRGAGKLPSPPPPQD
ncbi:MAG: hypothetical protein JWN92_1528 [Candidatus Acidoferrum typicum]|nr:hypothetical protein [Candidatus Acidoferrum typicum]